MSPDTKKPSFPALLSHMVKTEGVASIYAGLSAALMRQAIYGTARIGLHRTFSDKLQEVRDGAFLPACLPAYLPRPGLFVLVRMIHYCLVQVS